MIKRRTLFGWLLAPFAVAATPAKADNFEERFDRVIDKILWHGMQLDMQCVSEYGRTAYISLEDAETLREGGMKWNMKLYDRPRRGERFGMLDRFTLYVL